MDFFAQPLMRKLATDEQARINRDHRAWLHYNGEAEAEIAPAADGVDDSVAIMRARPIVDKTVSFLYGADQGGVQLQTNDKAVEGKIAECWPVDERALTLTDCGVNAAVAGHQFVRLRLDGRVQVLNPSFVYPQWKADDYEVVEAWKLQYTTVDPATNRPATFRTRIEPNDASAAWDIVDERSDEMSSWRETGRETWPYEWAPMIGAKNLPAPNEYWGTPDLTKDVLDLIEKSWSVLAYMHRLVRFGAHPRPYATGVKKEEVERLSFGQDKFLLIGSDKAQVGQLTAQDKLGAALELYHALEDGLREITRMPEVAAGRVERVGALSGFALQILYGPLLEKTRTKRQYAGPFVCEIAKRKLELAYGIEDADVNVNWSELLPQDPTAEVERYEALDRIGAISKQTVAEKAGLDWEVEQERMADEREQAQAAFDRGQVGDSDDVPPNFEQEE